MGVVKPGQLDGLAGAGDMPLCMSQLHKHLTASAHLKYGGRQQYGLFLKAMGVTMGDALAFFRAAFTHHGPMAGNESKFDKEYSYNIRHSYGQEGKRVDYSPYNCQKIITNAPGMGDTHGCPFAHYDRETLRETLAGENVSPAHSAQLITMVESKRYQQACARYYEVRHGVEVGDTNPRRALSLVVHHPNGYFNRTQGADTDNYRYAEKKM